MKRIKKLIFALALTFTMIVPNVLPVVGNTVVAQAATVKINKKTLALEVGKTSSLKISGTKKKVTWTSSKKTVATVSATGKVTAKTPGTATITATVDRKKYACKVTVKTATIANKYLKDAPFDAVEKKIGGISIVIPKDWEYEAQELTSKLTAAAFAPVISNNSYVNIKIIKTGVAAPDYSQSKEYFSDLITKELIQQQLEVAYNTTDIQINDFLPSDFAAKLNTAYRTEYTATIAGSTSKQVIYDMYTDNYLFEVTLSDSDKLDLDTVAQYVLNSIVVTK